MIASEKANGQSAAGAAIARNAALSEDAHAEGFYIAQCVGPSDADRPRYIALRKEVRAIESGPFLRRAHAWTVGPLRALRRELRAIPLHEQWREAFPNTVITEGKNALLTHGFKGSSYTAAMFMGLIEDTGYSAIAAGNTAANITAVGGGAPANGWNEAPSGTCAARGTPSFGTASAGALALSSALAFAIDATDTIRGVFLMIRSAAGTAPTSTVGNTNGAIYSAGLFTGGDRAVIDGDTLNVSYSASL
jgi:hypothetical protein